MVHDPIPRKSLGQHWLTDQASLEAIARAAEIKPTDVVVEIGPGLGPLTELLVREAKQVIAIELDEQLAQQLPTRIQANNLMVIQEDILRFDLTSVPAGYKVVANIPYYLTSNLIRVLSESTNPPVVAVLLVQQEVAERVAAVPGGMSLLSVSAQWYWHVKLGIPVPAQLFTPPPKVDSQVLVLERHPQALYPDVDTKSFFRIIKAGFSQRRKTLLNSLSAGLQRPKNEIITALEQSGINPLARPQDLTLGQWHELYIYLTR